MYNFSESLFAGRWTLLQISSDPLCGNADPVALCLFNILREFSITKSKLRPTLPVGGASALGLVQPHITGTKISTTGVSHLSLLAGVLGAFF